MKSYGSHVARWEGIGEPYSVEREPTCECAASSKLVDGLAQEVGTPPHATSVKGPQARKGGAFPVSAFTSSDRLVPGRGEAKGRCQLS